MDRREDTDPHGEVSREVNPFSLTAVAHVADVPSDVVTVETTAIRTSVGYLDNYLSSLRAREGAPDDVPASDAVAVLGEHGTGKTHLALHLLRHAQHLAGDASQAIYLDSPGDSFFALYRRFLEKVERNDLRERVRDYYADVVADVLERSELTASFAPQLRSGELDPAKIVKNLNLMDSALERALRDRLRVVTRNEAFGTALTLLLRPGFESAVWEWLSGYEPDQILRERGIVTQTSDDASAIEAMGVFVLLYSRRHRPFVLIIDEVDRVLAFGGPEPRRTTTYLKRLLEVMAAAGAFTVLVGLPDFHRALPPDVRQRLAHVVPMSAMSGREVRQFIEESQRRTFGEPRLSPFTAATADYLARLADGAVRRIVRLCYDLYRQASDQQTLVNDAMIREVARQRFDAPSLDAVREALRRALDNMGLRYQRDHVLGPAGEARADYWVNAIEGDVGCAILLSESVLKPEEVEDIRRRVSAIRAAAPDSEALLVLFGYAPADLADELSVVFGAEPILYDSRDFEGNLTAALRQKVGALDRLAGDDHLAVVRERVERMSRQQTNTQSFIEQLVAHLDDLRSDSERQFTTIQREIRALGGELAGVATQAGQAGQSDAARREDRGVPADGPLPANVDRLFDHALGLIKDVEVIDGMVREAFEAEGGESARSARSAVRAGLRRPESVNAIGVALLLRRLVHGFRGGLRDWYRSAGQPSGPLAAESEERLLALCRTYEAIYEYLPLVRLDALNELTGRFAEADVVDQLARARRRTELRSTFDGLAARVRAAVRAGFADPREA
jgi:Cdc6-like AAA superfamily ATPase